MTKETKKPRKRTKDELAKLKRRMKSNGEPETPAEQNKPLNRDMLRQRQYRARVKQAQYRASIEQTQMQKFSFKDAIACKTTCTPLGAAGVRDMCGAHTERATMYTRQKDVMASQGTGNQETFRKRQHKRAQISSMCVSAIQKAVVKVFKGTVHMLRERTQTRLTLL